MRFTRPGRIVRAIFAGLLASLPFAAATLLLIPPSAGLRSIVAPGLIIAAGLAAVVAAQRLDRCPPVAAVARERHLWPGGLVNTPEAMMFLEEQLNRGESGSEPLCLALLGVDKTDAIELPDAMEALRQLTVGTARRDVVITDRGPSELLLIMTDTLPSAGAVIAERIVKRFAAVGAGQIRCVLASATPAVSMRQLLEELDSCLAACREAGTVICDPSRQLEVDPPGWRWMPAMVKAGPDDEGDSPTGREPRATSEVPA